MEGVRRGKRCHPGDNQVWSSSGCYTCRKAVGCMALKLKELELRYADLFMTHQPGD